MIIDESSICIKPFSTIEICPSGEVYTCCPFHLDKYSLGNLNLHSFEDIWFSQRAFEIRNKILNKDYSLCREKNCLDFTTEHGQQGDVRDALKFKGNERAGYPIVIKYGFDEECNVQCIYCRDRVIRNSAEEVKKIENYIDKLSEAIKHCKIIYASGNGDPFTGGCAEMFLKKVAEKSSSVEFSIHTNGILCTKQKLEQLKLNDRLGSINISLPGATKQTYDRVVKYGNFNKVIENIEYLSSLKASGVEFDMHLSFVVCSLNYHEIVLFAQLAEKYNANAYFWEVRPMGSPELNSQIDKISVSNFSKEQLEELKLLLNHEVMKKPHVILNPLLKDIGESQLVI